MSLSANFPTIRPSLLLDFANTQTLDPRITFTRSTTAVYYDGVTTAKAEENLLKYSQQFDDAVWAPANATVTANTTVAPDGTTTADTFTGNVAGVTALISQVYLLPAGTFVLSLYAKAGTNDIFDFGYTAQTVISHRVTVDLSVPSIVNQSGTTTNMVIESVGNGWYRCSFQMALGAAALANSVFTIRGNAASLSGENFYLWGAQLEQRSSVTAYTATTTQPITNYVPVLQTAAANVARFDHNPTTGESLGLLIEEQRTNLQIYSQALSNSTWNNATPVIPTRVDNINVAPDGTQTATMLTAATGGTGSQIRALTNTTSSIGSAYSASFFVKQYDSPRTTLTLFDTTSGFNTVASLAVTWSGGIPSVASSSGSYVILPVGNGWYRLTVTGNTLYTNAQLMISLFPDTQSGTKSIFAWGAQLEAGAFPTSYIATTTASVTRTPDAASMTGTNFSSWFNNAEGTIYCNAKYSAASQINTFYVGDGTTANGIFVGKNTAGSGSTSAEMYVRANSANQAFPVKVDGVIGIDYVQIAATYKVNDFSIAAQNTLGTADTSGIVPVCTQALIGQYIYSPNILSQYIKKIAYYPERLTNAQLQGLTS